MPGGETGTSELADSLPSIIHSARQRREQKRGFVQTVDVRRLPMGTGRNWQEIDLQQLDSQAVGEKQTLDNPQQLTDTLLSIEPTMIGVHLLLTPQVKHYMATNVAGQIGGLMQNANEKKKDRDGSTKYDGATVTGGGAGTTLNSGIVAAMVSQIKGDTDEAAAEDEPVYVTLHEFQRFDVRTEITSGIGTYAIPAGMTADTFAAGGGSIEMIGGGIVKLNNNVRIDGNVDAHGGVHAKSGLILIEVPMPSIFTDVKKNMGGAEVMWAYDWYGWGERSAGNWVKRLLTDATAPTSG